jgi:hypothetical protein
MLDDPTGGMGFHQQRTGLHWGGTGHMYGGNIIIIIIIPPPPTTTTIILIIQSKYIAP